jgi:hypothetical protein
MKILKNYLQNSHFKKNNNHKKTLENYIPRYNTMSKHEVIIKLHSLLKLKIVSKNGINL